MSLLAETGIKIDKVLLILIQYYLDTNLDTNPNNDISITMNLRDVLFRYTSQTFSVHATASASNG